MVKDVLQQRHVVVAASWSPFEVLIHQDQITQSTFLAPDPFSCLQAFWLLTLFPASNLIRCKDFNTCQPSHRSPQRQMQKTNQARQKCTKQNHCVDKVLCPREPPAGKTSRSACVPSAPVFRFPLVAGRFCCKSSRKCLVSIKPTTRR